MAALVEAMREGRITAEPAVVVSNVPEAPGLARARAWGIPTEVVDHRLVKPREEHERAVVAILKAHRVDLVCLAGYMRLLTPYLVSEFRNRILNVHPALLPAFPGMDAQKQALEHGVKVTGCTVHLVDEECDQGPIVCQAAVPVLEDDSVESLSARILEEEHRIYARAVALYFEGRLSVQGRRVEIRPQ
jgi:phosphoribosylglycinamide formyltransferase-1